MSLPLSKASKGAAQAEVVLQPQLKSCLVNLPSSLVSVLVNANTVAIASCRMTKKQTDACR
jgi:peroxin-1